MSLEDMKGWFVELNSQWPGIACSLEVTEVLHDEKSAFQHVIVFKSRSFGNVLVLDGVIQITEKDEAAYQEMIAHPPLFCHTNPERVLVIGGGDGGVIREVVKHACVKEIVICEIDQMVIDCGKQYFPSVATAWDDKRVRLVCDDASKFIKLEENAEAFDVIICDSSDPVGPAEALFEAPFYRAMEKTLRPGGRISTQAESMWMHLPLIKKLVATTSGIFENVGYMTTQIPTYPCGQIGLLQCSKAQDVGNQVKRRKTNASTVSFSSFKQPARPIPKDFPTKYWTPELHAAAFRLPRFCTEAIQDALKPAPAPVTAVEHPATVPEVEDTVPSTTE